MRYAAILIFLVATTSAHGTDYFIKPAATGTGDCSSSANACTFATVESHITVGAAATCTATWTSASGIGACVHVATGTYSSPITNNKAGTASARIRYVCDTQYGCTFNESSSGTIWTFNSPFVDMVGMDFNGAGHTGVTTGLTVFNQDVLVQYNRFHDVGSACNTSNNAVAASFFNTASGHGNRFIGNLFYHNNCGVGHVSGVGNAMTALGLDSYDIAQDNIIMDHGEGYAVQISHGFPVGGVYTCLNAVFTNNTIVNVDRGTVLGFCNNVINGYTISNNIVANVQGGAGTAFRIHEGSGCGSNNIYASNLVYGATAYTFDSPCTGTPTGTQTGSNAATFVNYGTGTIGADLHLKALSTAIGHGTKTCASGISNCAPAADFSGVSFPSGTATDIGAYAFVTSGGAPAVSFSPTSVNFGTVPVSTPSANQNDIMTNSGTGGNLTFTPATISGTNAGDFTIVSNGCVSPLAQGVGCTYTLRFTPSASGSSLGLSYPDRQCLGLSSFTSSGRYWWHGRHHSDSSFTVLRIDYSWTVQRCAVYRLDFKRYRTAVHYCCIYQDRSESRRLYL